MGLENLYTPCRLHSKHKGVVWAD